MATRADFDLKNAIVKTYSIKSGTALVNGNRVRFGASDTEVDLTSGVGDDTCIGTASIPSGTTLTGNAAGSVLVQVVLDFVAIVPMLVGTDGSTRGLKQVNAANGITDAPTNGGGTTSRPLQGVALQSGVVGDLIGVGICPGRSVSA